MIGAANKYIVVSAISVATLIASGGIVAARNTDFQKSYFGRVSDRIEQKNTNRTGYFRQVSDRMDRTQLDQYTDQIDDLKQQIEELKAEAEDLQADIQRDLDQYLPILDDIKAQAEEYKARIDAAIAAGDYEQLKQIRDEIKAKKEEYAPLIAEIKQKIAEYKARIEELKQKAQEIKDEADQIKGDIKPGTNPGDGDIVPVIPTPPIDPIAWDQTEYPTPNTDWSKTFDNYPDEGVFKTTTRVFHFE